MTASPDRSQTSESVATKELSMVERFNKERGMNMLVTSEVIIQKQKLSKVNINKITEQSMDDVMKNSDRDSRLKSNPNLEIL